MKRFLRQTDLRPNAQREVSDELRFHLEMRTQEFIDAGMSPEDARTLVATIIPARRATRVDPTSALRAD